MEYLITKAQGTGCFNIQKSINETKKKIENGERILEEATEKISGVKETDSRAISEYNPNGHLREDYDTKKQLDIFA